MAILEVCVDSVASAINAQAGGATRLELCGNLIIGGTTPSFALFEAVKAAVDIPVNVLIRPRFGDFLYSQAEYEIMCREIAWFADHGANAVVIGSLHADGTLHKAQMQGMIVAAKGIHITLHRAFDVSRDPEKTLEEAIELGVDTILTSGQKASALAGKELLNKLQRQAGSRAKILVGAGVNASAIRTLRQENPDFDAFHLSGKEVLDSGMVYRNEEVNMGMPGISEFQIWQTNKAAIRAARDALIE